MLRYSSAANEAETKAESAAAEHVSAMLAKERELSATQLALNKAHSDVAAAEKAKADAEGEAARELVDIKVDETSRMDWVKDYTGHSPEAVGDN